MKNWQEELYLYNLETKTTKINTFNFQHLTYNKDNIFILLDRINNAINLMDETEILNKYVGFCPKSVARTSYFPEEPLDEPLLSGLAQYKLATKAN